MASDIPLDRVRRLQADLWRLSGLTSYDPAGSSLPPLPSVADAIAAFGPDLPPSLGCGRCGGGLLRGLQSTICIYCGADRRDQGFSHSISFNSTAACRKLLDFLGLDGSYKVQQKHDPHQGIEDPFFLISQNLNQVIRETVLLDTESSGSNKGHDTPKSELVLSDLLDLELRWPSDKVDFDDSITITSRSPDEYSLNLTGGDLDYFFSERKKDVLRVQEPNKELMLRKNTDTKVNASSGSDNFAAFDKLQAKDAKVSSSSNFNEFPPPISTEFAVWNSPTVTMQTTTVSPNSLDLFQDSSLHDLAHASRTEASIDQLKNVEDFAETGSKLRPSISVNEIFENDFWPMDFEKIDALTLPKTETSENTVNSVPNDISSTFMDHFTIQEDLWPANNSREPGISGQVNPKDDLFDDWQDFTCSTGAKGSSTSLGQETGLSFYGSETMTTNLFPESNKTELQEKVPTIASNNVTSDDWQDFTSFSQHESSSIRTQRDLDVFEQSFEIKSADMRSKVVPDSLVTLDVVHDSSDVLKNFAGSSGAPEDSLNQRGQIVITPYEDSLGTDPMDPWHTHNTKDSDKNKPLHGDHDSFVDWQDLTTLSEVVHRSANVGAPSVPTLLEKPTETKLEESANGHDDTFDDWQDFASSVGVQGSLSSPREHPSASLFQNRPEKNSINQQVLKEDGPSDALKSQKDYHVEENMQLDSLIFERSNDVDQAGVDSHPMIWDLNDTTASSNANSNSESAKANVEKLTSKMHDLSFMLVDELSIPTKPTKG